MPLNARRLRLWFACAIAALVLIVLGFYFRGYYTRYLVSRAIKNKADKLGVDIQQSADQFTLSKSEGGRTLFTIRASKAVQVKGGHAELRDVNIVVYGNQGNRFDQIYGKSFEYDAKTGIVQAAGEVHIDLQGVAVGQIRPDLAPPKELQNPIHLKTSGLTFDRNTGIAMTNERIDFRVPQASGSAVGATLESKSNRLTLHSDIELQQSGDNGAKLVAKSGLITKDPPRIEFTDARMSRQTSDIDAQRLTVYLRDDNTIEKVLANGNVTAVTHGKTEARAQAPQGLVLVDGKNQVRTATLSGGVNFESLGEQPTHGTAGRVLFDFGGNNRLDKVHAVDNVRLVQDPPKDHPNGQTMTLNGQAIDYFVRQHRAESVGPGEMLLRSGDGGNKSSTVATADRITAIFSAKGRLETLVGTPNTKIVSSNPGQSDKVTTSNVLTLSMNPAGGLARIVQEGDFHYIQAAAKPGEAGSEATAAKAVYDPQTEMFTLSGNPRVTDAGATTTADHMRVNRRTGDAFANGSVKTTYSELKAQPNGALLATSDPIHVTAASMVAHRTGGTAVYSGGARLWQGSNIVEAPTIDFDRDKRTVVAQGKPGQPVSTVFVQPSQNGKQSPVNVTGSRLSYSDSDRQAHFDGGVVLRSSDGTISADRATVYLLPRQQNASTSKISVENSASQLEKIVAEGHIVIQQGGRRGTGDKLVYLAKDASFTLTGGPPSIFDAEHGKITGVSLTFFSHDDRVLVEGGKSAPSVTKARVSK
jgi:lipopolysaccharide export system protein LptA